MAEDRPPRDRDALVPLGYLFAVLVPFVGLILGIIAATRGAASAARRHGPWIIATAAVVLSIEVAVGVYLEIRAAQHPVAAQAPPALPDKEEAEQRWCPTHTPSEPPGSVGCRLNENVGRLERGEAPE